LKRLLKLFFLFLSFLFFFLAPSLEDLGILMIFEKKILELDIYFRMELCTPTSLNHDYGDGGVMDILPVDAYSVVELCTPIIFLSEASK
jgi:hypothetical protein